MFKQWFHKNSKHHNFLIDAIIIFIDHYLENDTTQKAKLAHSLGIFKKEESIQITNKQLDREILENMNPHNSSILGILGMIIVKFKKYDLNFHLVIISKLIFKYTGVLVIFYKTSHNYVIL